MASDSHFDIIPISSTNNKYHIFLTYLIDEEGNYGGGFREKALSISGGGCGESFNDMLEDAYASLKAGVEGEHTIPFDVSNIKESVVFDCLECYTTDEMDVSSQLEAQGKTFTEIVNEIARMQKKKKN